MTVTRNDRGFQIINHPVYAPEPDEPATARLVQASSIIYDRYDDSWDKPGSSALWIGKYHHLDREEVRELVQHLQKWLDTGLLDSPTTPEV